MSSSSLVLITGVTGHVGFKALLDALKAGYKVRAAVRSEQKGQNLLSQPLLKAANVSTEQLSIVVVPDLTVAGAYDEAAKGVDYVIHIASPLTTGSQMSQEEYKKYFIEPAVHGTVGMLESAAKAGSVKRVVITSSVVAIAPWSAAAGGSETVFTGDSRTPSPEGPYASEFEAYSASKTYSLNEAEKWVEQNKPSYDVVYIQPSFIEGRNDLVQTAKGAFEGTNAFILGIAAGQEPSGLTLPGASVHNDDVARLHVEALNPRIPAGGYVANWNSDKEAHGTRWEEINSVIAKQFPEAVKSGLLSNKGGINSVHVPFDSKKTEETFGWKLQGIDEQVKSVVGHYVELLSKA